MRVVTITRPGMVVGLLVAMRRRPVPMGPVPMGLIPVMRIAVTLIPVMLIPRRRMRTVMVVVHRRGPCRGRAMHRFPVLRSRPSECGTDAAGGDEKPEANSCGEEEAVHRMLHRLDDAGTMPSPRVFPTAELPLLRGRL